MFRIKRWLGILMILCSLLICIGAIFVSLREPSNNLNWSGDQKILPEVSFLDSTGGMEVSVKNIRDTVYTSRDEYEVRYYDWVFRVEDVVSVDFFVEELFSVAVAHTFLSFGFVDGSHLMVSTEIRKEQWEEFSPLKGFFREYELMYVLASEEDILKVRWIHRDNPVYRYELQLSDIQKQDLFVSMMKKAEMLHNTPEFYNTFLNSCNQLIVEHLRSVGIDIPFDYRIFLPKQSGAFLYGIDLIDIREDFSVIQADALITPKIQSAEWQGDFSRYIRGGLD